MKFILKVHWYKIKILLLLSLKKTKLSWIGGLLLIKEKGAGNKDFFFPSFVCLKIWKEL